MTDSTPGNALSLPRIGAGDRRKLQLAIDAKLAAELEAYARAYEEAYGERAEIEALIPHMLARFIAGDRHFRKWKTGRAKNADAQPRGGNINSGREDAVTV